MREIALNVETTGLQHETGHRVIEISCVEILNGIITDNIYHQYINPKRDINEAAIEVHGITPEFLENKPVFSNIANKFIEFIKDANIIAHNADFDVGFLNAEMAKIDKAAVDQGREVIDTLRLARNKHPGQKNNIDALTERLNINNENLSGSTLFAYISAVIYLKLSQK